MRESKDFRVSTLVVLCASQKPRKATVSASINEFGDVKSMVFIIWHPNIPQITTNCAMPLTPLSPRSGITGLFHPIKPSHYPS
jgi:hypothetical protein